MSAFNSLYADQYDELYAAKGYGQECDLIEQAVALYGGSRPSTVLDVGCGTGGHAMELATRGYAVSGVDLSQPMLDRAALKAAALPAEQQPSWLCGDARDFNTDRQHDLAIMMFAVVGYLTKNEDVLQALRNIRRQLKPGSLFLCDFWYGPSVLSTRPTDRVRVMSSNEGRVIRAASTELDTLAHTADVTFKLWTLAGDRLVGETSETHRMRYFFPQEFSLFLSSAGFEMKSISAFPTLDGALDENAWNAFVVASAV